MSTRCDYVAFVIDNLTLLLTHGLLLITAWRLLSRSDLDQEPPARPPEQIQKETPTGFARKLRKGIRDDA